MIKTITYNPETHVLVPREPSEEMFAAANKIDDEMYCGGSQHGADIDQVYYAMIDAAPQPEQVESKPVPDFRGYAALGTGQYLLNACPATEVLPAELVISIATEEEKAGRVIGDLKDVEPGTEIDPSSMAVRLAFFSVSGLDALEQQLRILREESFPNTTPQPDRVAELEAETTKLKLDLLTSYGEAEELSGKVAELEKALKAAREAIDALQNGLKWYQDAYPDSISEADHEEIAKVDAAIDKINEVLGHA